MKLSTLIVFVMVAIWVGGFVALYHLCGWPGVAVSLGSQFLCSMLDSGRKSLVKGNE